MDKIYNGLVTTSLENPQETVKDPSKLFYGTQMCYIFLRLHHTLYIRLSMAHKLALEAAQHQAYLEESAAGSNNRQFTSNYNRTTLLQHMDAPDTEAHMLNGEAAPTAKSRPIYNQFFGYLLSLVEGNIDNAKFEDITRSLLGNKSYMLYTLDKIINQGIKHLQAMANDENVNKLVGLFVYHHYKATTGAKAGIDPTLYQNHVSHILSHTMEDVYRIQVKYARYIWSGYLTSCCAVVDSKCRNFSGHVPSGYSALGYPQPQRHRLSPEHQQCQLYLQPVSDGCVNWRHCR